MMSLGDGRLALVVVVGLLLAGLAARSEAQEEAAPQEKTIAGHVVDEEGNPVPGVHIYLMGFNSQSGYVVSDEQGRFQAPRGSFEDLDERFESILQAFDDHQSPQLFAEPTWSNKEIKALENADQLFRELTVIVKRPSTAKVRVVDGEGNPVEGANVSGRVGNNTSLETVTSNEQGEALLKVTGKLPLYEVLAYKGGVGLDYRYFQNLEPGKRHEPPVKEYPAEGVTLVLDGVRPVEVTVQDRQGRPVEGAEVTAEFSVARVREGVDGRMPVAHSPIEDRQLVTDAQGRANFDWFPAWTDATSISFQVTSEKHLPVSWSYYFDLERYNRISVRSLPMRERDQRLGNVPGSGKLVIEVEEPVSIRGTVRDQAGNPVAGIRVAAGNGLSGRVVGASTDIHATTDDQGRYELPVGIHYAYLVTVKDDERVSDTQGPIAIFPDQPVDAVDLTLRPTTTRLYGRLTDAEGTPIRNAQIHCRQIYFDTAKLAELGLPNPQNLPQPIRPTITRWVRTDAEGRFEFMVGPGHYAIQHSVRQQGRPSDPRSPSPYFEFQIDDEAERQIDLKVEAPDPPRTRPRPPPR